MRVGNWLGWTARACEVLAAATILLVLIQLHTGIMQSALTMFGARTDVPLLLSIDDRCKSMPVPPAWANARSRSQIAATCGNEVHVTTTVPTGQKIVLFVNDQPVATQEGRSPLVTFFNVRLRPGVNSLVVADANAQLEFPHPALNRTGQLDRDVRGRSYRVLNLLSVPAVEASYAVSILLDPTKQEPGRMPSDEAVIPRWYGPFVTGSGDVRRRWFLVQGLPGTEAAMPPNGLLGVKTTIGADGFGTAYAYDDKLTAADLASLPIRRALTIRGDADNTIELALSACLPPDHPYVTAARRGLIGAPELISRLTGYFLSLRLSATDARWRQKIPVKVTGQSADTCVLLTASYRLNSTVDRHWAHTFLQLPGDELVVDASLANVLTPSVPPDSSGAEGMIWHGGSRPFGRNPPWFNRSGALFSPMQSAGSDQPDSEVRIAARQGLLDHWRNLSEALPAMIQSMLWALAVMLPVALIYWALGRHRDHNPKPKRIDQARAGVRALLIFMAALALQPILLELSRVFVDQTGFWTFVTDDARVDRIYRLLFAPIAFVAVLMVVPLLRTEATPAGLHTRWWTRAPLAVISVLLVAIALGVASLERWIVDGFTIETLKTAVGEVIGNDDAFGDSTIAVLLGSLVLAWCGFGLLTFWIPVYWLARSVVQRGPLLGATFAAAALTFFLPMVTPAAEAVRMLIALGTGTYSQFGSGAALLSGLAAFTSVAGVVIMVTLVLRGFREMTAVMLDPAAVPRFRLWSHTGILFLIAILIVGPTTGALASVDTANLRVYQFMTIFHAYGGLLALIAPFVALRILDESHRGADLTTRFDIEDTVLKLLTATFAGYLSLWVREPIGAPILIAIGWFVFSYGIIGPPPKTEGAAAAGLAKHILAYRTETRLLEARRKTIEKEFADGKIDTLVLASRRTEIDQEFAKARDALGMPVDEAKRRLLSFGPGTSPLQNGLVGAGTGLVVAGLLQIVLPIDFGPGSTAHTPAWLNILHAFIVDPNYRPVGSAANVSRLLALVSEILNAVTIWVFLGFLFGFAFHRIRGGDGFAKAIVFGTGIAATFLVSQALIARGAGVPLGNLARLVPIFVFLIFLGSLVFDGRSLQRQGVPLAQLPDMYGLRTSIGYASFAGIIAGVQPLLQFLDWVFSRAS